MSSVTLLSASAIEKADAEKSDVLMMELPSGVCAIKQTYSGKLSPKYSLSTDKAAGRLSEKWTQ